MTRSFDKFVWAICLSSLLVHFGACVTLTKTSFNRPQRRFMWKQMDHTVDGIMDKMFSSARAMKSMFGDLLPAEAAHPTALPLSDYMPSETTRVRYIIRSPRTHKPVKIIKVHPPKKVHKLHKFHNFDMPHKLEKEQENKFPSMNTLHKLEKEQEMIAEGRLPPKPSISDVSSMLHFDHDFEKPDDLSPLPAELHVGHINELGDEWQPVSMNQSILQRPYVMSPLHTSIYSEPLPEPEKLVQKSTLHGVPETRFYDAPTHTYEVTEYTAEESVALPLAQEYRNIHGFLPTARSAQFVPTYPPPTSTSTNGSSSISTTTEDLPNYPAPFLRKYRERVQQPKHTYAGKQQQFTGSATTLDTSWLPSANVSHISARSKKPSQTAAAKYSPWSSDVYSTRAPTLRTTTTTTTTEVTLLPLQYQTESHPHPHPPPPPPQPASSSFENIRKSAYKSNRFRTSAATASAATASAAAAAAAATAVVAAGERNTRTKSATHRGTVKYGDKLE